MNRRSFLNAIGVCILTGPSLNILNNRAHIGVKNENQVIRTITTYTEPDVKIFEIFTDIQDHVRNNIILNTQKIICRQEDIEFFRKFCDYNQLVAYEKIPEVENDE